MKDTIVRLAHPSDCNQLAKLRNALWPSSSVEEHAQELREILAGSFPAVMPLVVLVAQANDGKLVGFLEAGLRSYAEGCDASHAVGYVEGWYIAPNCRRQGIGADLLRAAEDWARSKGCIEMASDAAIGNQDSLRAHQAQGFEVVERSVHFRKTLRPVSDS